MSTVRLSAAYVRFMWTENLTLGLTARYGPGEIGIVAVPLDVAIDNPLHCMPVKVTVDLASSRPPRNLLGKAADDQLAKWRSK